MDKPGLIIGIGASAGGLETFTQLLQALPPDTGMAFVLVQHLDPRHESLLASLLRSSSTMQIQEAKNGMVLASNQVYVIPPNVNMTIYQSAFRMTPRIEKAGLHMPIDCFLRSLAEEEKSRAIGIILSGTASDGVLGLRAIKAEGGITFAQDPQSAKYDGMPRAAIAAGCVDAVLAPADIARELVRISRHPYFPQLTGADSDGGALPRQEMDALTKMFLLLRNSSGVDFTYYKHTTLKRRIIRRMLLHKLHSLSEYAKYLQGHRQELNELYEDLLINVTNFFRDAEIFDIILKTKLLPALLKNRQANAPIRVWIPGCSTGEEAYSIAIALQEFLGEADNQFPIQIFGTDISERAIEKARAGDYPETIDTDVSPDRLRRFFIKTEQGYQIRKSIRDLCIFARQNVVKDPPFSKLDIVSCRNMLIYLGPVLQKKIIPIFHYALHSQGYLILGSSESIGPFTDLFSIEDKKNKIYVKRPVAPRVDFDFAVRGYSAPAAIEPTMPEFRPAWGGFDTQKEADRILLSKYTPPGVLVSESGDILSFRGRTSTYLEPAPGQASLNLLKMAREGLQTELRSAFQAARKAGTPVQRRNITLRQNGRSRVIDIEIIPIKATPLIKERAFLVLFKDVAALPVTAKGVKAAGKNLSKAQRRLDQREVSLLRQELNSAKEYLQSIIEEQEATNEELRSANEEIQSTNEELQSTNEEMETAKEELQSANEELTTVNEELQNRNQELNQLNNDLINLLSSVQIPILMLGHDLRIRRFTPLAEKLLHLIPGDAGRLITDINLDVPVQDLQAMITEVIESLSVKEREVQDRQGRWYSMRVRPYKTTENKIDGVVIAFVDITDMKSNYARVQRLRDIFDAVLDTLDQPLVVLDDSFTIQMVNPAFCRSYNLERSATEGKNFLELGTPLNQIPRLREALAKAGQNGEQRFEAEQTFPGAGPRLFQFTVRKLDHAAEKRQSVLLTISNKTT